jgi:hypothetical protein
MSAHTNKIVGAALLAAGALGLTRSAAAQQGLTVYGYFASRLEKTYNEPSFDGTQIVEESSPREWGMPFFNVMMQHQLSDRFRAFVNLNGSGAGELDVRNAWGEFSASGYFNVRLGKIYRRFGLYNEILDAVPTYYGIEPPETFDLDHLVLTRTTTVMVYGQIPVGPGTVNYSVTTDNGESGGLTGEGAVPVGGDVNFKFGRGRYTVGVSGYRSGTTAPDKALGDGSPRSGVLPWMASDQFDVVNAYGEARVQNLTLQVEWAQASHDAVRDPDAVLEVLAAADVNAAQRARFLVDPAGDDTDPANVRTDAPFTVRTWYVRAGYSFYTSAGEIGPYFQWDRYSNPETIASKTWGGDNEAGVADDGVFNKGTLGIVYRPIPQVAIKLDGSSHFYRFMGQSVSYPEFRFDVSYTFGL